MIACVVAATTYCALGCAIFERKAALLLRSGEASIETVLGFEGVEFADPRNPRSLPRFEVVGDVRVRWPHSELDPRLPAYRRFRCAGDPTWRAFEPHDDVVPRNQFVLYREAHLTKFLARRGIDRAHGATPRTPVVATLYGCDGPVFFHREGGLVSASKRALAREVAFRGRLPLMLAAPAVAWTVAFLSVFLTWR